MEISYEEMVKDEESKEVTYTTLGVCWNLIGHEGNISRVAAGLNKAARESAKPNLRESQQKNENKNRFLSHTPKRLTFLYYYS